MNMRMTLVAAALTGLALGGAAFAKADKPHGPRMTFEQLDGDKDGQITETEMKAQGAARFAKMDTDGDGFITTTEIEAAGQEKAKKRASRMMKHLDADNDGKLSLEEMGKRGRKGDMFAKFEQEGLSNADISLSYRDKVLAAGGTKDAADLVEDFLGRPFNYDAFINQLNAE